MPPGIDSAPRPPHAALASSTHSANTRTQTMGQVVPSFARPVNDTKPATARAEKTALPDERWEPPGTRSA